MAAKFLPRPLYFPFATNSPLRFFRKPLSICLISTTNSNSITTTTIFSTLDHYGPSLHKGHKPYHLNPSIYPNSPNLTINTTDDNDSDLLDESIFTRIYDIAALRVPSEQCAALESSLRGHLLNWPRIRNIARVPGDDIEEEYKTFLENRNKESIASLSNKIYRENSDEEGEVLSPVLYRDKLVKTFNSRGYVKFRNLAKLSRPKRRKKEGKEEGRRENAKQRRIEKNEMVLVEVVEDEASEDEEAEDMSGLLGEEFKGRKWRGSTRLLLLDGRYANKSVEDMPEAIKVNLFPHALVARKLFYKPQATLN